MRYELRLEVNIDAVESDIEPELLRAIIEAAIRKKLAKIHYVNVQSVKLV